MTNGKSITFPKIEYGLVKITSSTVITRDQEGYVTRDIYCQAFGIAKQFIVMVIRVCVRESKVQISFERLNGERGDNVSGFYGLYC